MAQLMFTLWAIWHGRNSWVFEGSREEPLVTVGKAAKAWHDYLGVATKQGRGSGSRPIVRWQPPRMGIFKINVDGALFGEHHCAGLGVVVRDWEGHVIAAASRKIAGEFSVIVVEAMAVRYAMVLARELGLHSVEVEGDNAEIVHALTSYSTCLTSLGLIIEDILFDAAHFFDLASFCHIRREGNAVAHGLARFALNVDDCYVWVEEVPEFIRDLFLADLYQVSEI